MRRNCHVAPALEANLTISPALCVNEKLSGASTSEIHSDTTGSAILVDYQQLTAAFCAVDRIYPGRSPAAYVGEQPTEQQRL